MFRKFEGLGQALQQPNQSLSGLNQHPAIEYLRAICGVDGRYCRLGYGENLSIKIGTNVTNEANVEDQPIEGSKELILDREAFLLMLNLHPEQAVWEKRAQEFPTLLVTEVFPGRFEGDEKALASFIVSISSLILIYIYIRTNMMNIAKQRSIEERQYWR